MDATAPVQLGRTDLRVTRLGIGLAPVGGLYKPVGDEQGVATVDRAWERGLRLFDTAPLYGYGLSERRTGLALAKRPRAEYVLASFRPEERDAIERALDEAAARIVAFLQPSA